MGRASRDRYEAQFTPATMVNRVLQLLASAGEVKDVTHIVRDTLVVAREDPRGLSCDA